MNTFVKESVDSLSIHEKPRPAQEPEPNIPSTNQRISEDSKLSVPETKEVTVEDPKSSSTHSDEV